MTTEIARPGLATPKSEIYVTLLPAFCGPTAGYQAVLVEAYDDPEFCLEPDLTILRRGPFSDAYLLARTAAMRWAEQIHMPWRED